jgi:hypothetical protein
MNTYPSNLTYSQWQVIEKVFDGKMLKRKRDYSLRSIINAIFYLTKGGISGK